MHACMQTDRQTDNVGVCVFLEGGGTWGSGRSFGLLLCRSLSFRVWDFELGALRLAWKGRWKKRGALGRSNGDNPGLRSQAQDVREGESSATSLHCLVFRV